MKTPPPFLLASLVCILLLAQGCDTFSASEPPEPDASPALLNGLLDKTLRTFEAQHDFEASPDGKVHLVVTLEDDDDFSSYGVTKRRLNKYNDGLLFKLEPTSITQSFSIAVIPSILDDVLDILRNDPDIKAIEQDIFLQSTKPEGTGSSFFSQHIPWGLEHINAVADDFDSEVDIYVMDSGINASEEINLASSVDFIVPLLSRLSLSGLTNQLLQPLSGLTALDLVGHGTHIAATIAARDNGMGIRGVVPGAALHNLRVLGPDGGTDMSTLIAAVDYVSQQKIANPDRPAVVNLSIGADLGETTYNALDKAIQRSIELGVVYVIAAGNDAIDASTVTPAHVNEALTIGAHGERNRISPFSNYGDTIDLYAPGEDVVSVSHLLSVKRSIGDGTSYAAPYVTGVVARYLSKHPQASPDEVRQALLDIAPKDVYAAPLAPKAYRVVDSGF